MKHSKECGKDQCLIHTRIGDRCSCKCHNHNHTTIQCDFNCPVWKEEHR